jgi:chromosome segregation ATPase
MKTIKERLQDLKDKFEKRQKRVDEILDGIAEIEKGINNSILSTDALIDDLQKAVKNVNQVVEMLNKDYNNLKNDIEKIKNNFWFKLFGVK